MKRELQYRKRKLYDTDSMMQQLWSHLARDFRSTLDDPMLFREEENLLYTDMGAFRHHDWKQGFLSPPYYFKAKYQMMSLFKRYIFQKDPLSAENLETITVEKFKATQERIGRVRPIKWSSRLVVSRARSITRKILGEYDPEEHWNMCRFGKRASVGNPLAESYLDSKMGTSLSGSLDHIRWFYNRPAYSDPLIMRALSSCTPLEYPRYTVCDSLTLTCVPKSWKSLRTIMPNTTIGGFYSYGLGRVIQERLKAIGLDIRYRQEFHRALVRENSKTRRLVTADLSAASDSFTPWLVNMLVPRKWYRVLKLGRISNYTSPGTTGSTQMVSFCTMGIGFTFQLQTLLFYALLKAIGDLSGVNGLISVYGDDLIYPRKMHHIVKEVLADLNFNLNMEKTFVNEDFRESCGSDFYWGHDVRPFQPEGRSEQLGKNAYLAFLYKTVNGLARRWEKEEIPQTLRFLYAEILRVSDILHQVPPDFPDYSGIKVAWVQSDHLLPWSTVKRGHRNTGDYHFPYLAQPRVAHTVRWLFPFYWDRLRQMETGEDSNDFTRDLASEPNLQWVRAASKPYRTSSGNRFNYRLIPTVTVKSVNPSWTRKTGVTIMWRP